MEDIVASLGSVFSLEALRQYSWELFGDEDLGLYLLFGAVPVVALLLLMGVRTTRTVRATEIHRDREPNAYESSGDDNDADADDARDEMSLEEMMRSAALVTRRDEVARAQREAKEAQEAKARAAEEEEEEAKKLN